MLGIFLKILSVSGIVVLALCAFLVSVLLLVLFFPVTYRICGRKDNETEKMELSARLNWLFGLLRVRFSYPEPGILTVKILCFKLYQVKLPPEGKKDGDESDGEPERAEAVAGQEPSGEEKGADIKERPSDETAGKPEQEGSRSEEASAQEGSRPEEASEQEGSRPEEASGQEGSRPEEVSEQEGSRPEEASGQKETRPEDKRGGFFEKIQKIKYTICGIYDKIKEIWKNISYYTALLQEEKTRTLYVDVKQCVVKILKNIRPRRVRADILFGTGSPDTTGYVFGIYCMLYPALGAGFLVTPDFDRAVFEGRIDISGHITVFVLGINIARLMLDKRLRRFIRKLKKQDAAGGSIN